LTSLKKAFNLKKFLDKEEARNLIEALERNGFDQLGNGSKGERRDRYLYALTHAFKVLGFRV